MLKAYKAKNLLHLQELLNTGYVKLEMAWALPVIIEKAKARLS